MARFAFARKNFVFAEKENMSKRKRDISHLSNSDFDRLLAKEDHGTRERLSVKFESFWKNFDLLLKIARQLTDIHDEHLNVTEKLSNSSHRRFAFKQLKRQVSVCIYDLIHAFAMVDEQYVCSRLERTGELLKTLMDSWDIMLHSIEIIAKNPKLCTNLPDEIKLFHDIASADLEDYLEEFNKIKEEIMLRMPSCQLCNDEEFNLQIAYGSCLFDLKGLRFDKLILADQSWSSCDQEMKTSKTGKQVIKRKTDIVWKMTENFQRLKSREEDKSQVKEIKTEPSRDVTLSSCNSNGPSGAKELCGTIFRETYHDKESYIEAWAENQAKNNLQQDNSSQMDALLADPRGNINDKNCSAQVSVQPFLCSMSKNMTVLRKEDLIESDRIALNKRSLDCSDELPMKTRCLKISLNLEELRLQKRTECFRKTDCYVFKTNKEKTPENIQLSMPTKGVASSKSVFESLRPKKLRISIPIGLVRKENMMSSKDGKENIEGKQNVEQIENQTNLNSNEFSDSETLKSNVIKKEGHDKSCYSTPKQPACVPLKITLVRVGCYNWAVKENEMHSEGRLGKDGTVRIGALHELDEKAVKRVEILNRVKQALALEKSAKTVRSKLNRTKRFKVLKQRAVTLCAMKSQISRRKMPE